jgi:hypothetical protein
MPRRVKSILRDSKNYLVLTLTRFGLQAAKMLIGKDNNKISLSIDSKRLEDGLGAQLQRQLSVKALSNFLNIPFVPAPIEQIAIHPLDDFKTNEQMKNFINEVNELFNFSQHKFSENSKTLHVRILTIWNLIRFILLAKISDCMVEIKVLEAYSLVDASPQMYLTSLKDFKLYPTSSRLAKQIVNEDICIHYRQGVGGNAVYPGQNISRELNPKYFISILNQLNTKGKTITVLTDAPEQDFDFVPSDAQAHLWIGTPNYADGKVRIKGQNLKNIFAESGYQVEVVNGGDLLTTLLSMVSCKTLLMSRSSLSYVAALLNSKAKVYYPPNFWHPPLSHWNKDN